MNAGTERQQAGSRVLAVDACGRLRHLARGGWMERLRRGDAVIANDAATLPASLAGVHETSGAPIEVRLAGRESLRPDSIRRATAVVFGAGDFRQRTEDRPAPPPLRRGDRLRLGPLRCTVLGTLDHPRLVALRFEHTAAQVWAGLASHGRPVQYAHVPQPLQLRDVWTSIAAQPAALEAPSAGFALSWQGIVNLRSRGIAFATLTHAAGLSSTGDPVLDERLPLDEPYLIPPETAALVNRTRRRGARVIAVGTSVVRALEAAVDADGTVRDGEGVARLRIGPGSRLQVVDALMSGTHEPGTSHYQLLGAFIGAHRLRRVDEALAREQYRTHEFGDAVFVEKTFGYTGCEASRLALTTPAEQPASSRHGQRRAALSPASAWRQ